MIDDVLQELRDAIQRTQEALRRELSRLRTGRAHAGMLEGIRVDYYGQSTPLAQMATIGVPEPRLLTIKPWDKTSVIAVDKAIRESDLGLNPQVDGDLLRVPVPSLSEQRRKDLVKVAKKHGEECKIAARKARHEAIDMLTEIKESGDISEDDLERSKKKVDEIIAEASHLVDTSITSKEKEILTV